MQRIFKRRRSGDRSLSAVELNRLEESLAAAHNPHFSSGLVARRRPGGISISPRARPLEMFPGRVVQDPAYKTDARYRVVRQFCANVDDPFDAEIEFKPLGGENVEAQELRVVATNLAEWSFTSIIEETHLVPFNTLVQCFWTQDVTNPVGAYRWYFDHAVQKRWPCVIQSVNRNEDTMMIRLVGYELPSGLMMEYLEFTPMPGDAILARPWPGMRAIDYESMTWPQAVGNVPPRADASIIHEAAVTPRGWTVQMMPKYDPVFAPDANVSSIKP